MINTLITTAEITGEDAIKAWHFGYRLYTFPLINKELSYDTQVEERIFELGRSTINAVFTSEVAVRAVFERLEQKPDWNIYCLQGKTRTVLLKYVPEELIVKMATNSTELAAIIQSDLAVFNQRPSVFFCGDKRMPTLPVACKALDVTLEEVICYKTSCIPSNIGGDIEGILFFSPSAVECFFNHNLGLKKETVLFAIGETTAAAIRAFSSNETIVAPEPSQASLLNEVKIYFDKKKASEK